MKMKNNHPIDFPVEDTSYEMDLMDFEAWEMVNRIWMQEQIISEEEEE